MNRTITAAAAVILLLSAFITVSAENKGNSGNGVKTSAEISKDIQSIIIKKISELPEYKEAENNIYSKTGKDAGLSFLIEKSEESAGYSVQLGYNGRERFETYFFFHVKPVTYEIRILDIVSGEYVAMDVWRNRNNKKNLSVSDFGKESDIQLVKLSKKILAVLKERDYKSLATYVHPELGLRFSPYSFVDVKTDHKLTPADLMNVKLKGKKIKWGEYDGSGEPIIMTITEYFNRFVYDVDFLNRGNISINEVINSGNTANNIEEAYPGCEHVEFMFPGANPEFEGADWRVLRLVFKKIKDKMYLVGIIHSEWTV